jgi:hypothetical protein
MRNGEFSGKKSSVAVIFDRFGHYCIMKSENTNKVTWRI